MLIVVLNKFVKMLWHNYVILLLFKLVSSFKILSFMYSESVSVENDDRFQVKD